MKLHAELGADKHEIEIKLEDGKVFANIDGRSYELEASEPEPNVLLFKHEGKVYEVMISPPEVGRGDSTHVRIGHSEFDVRLIDPKRLRGSGADAAHADGLAEIKTAMPGKVVRILLETGAEVEKGDGVLVVEAMKMQNELQARRAGTVKAVYVSVGQRVDQGAPLLVLV